MTRHIICDPIHGSMSLDKSTHDKIKPIIDDPIFQRLRHIKQLSFAEYAYPGATHSRFSHSLGVAYLAGKIYDSVNINTSEMTRMNIITAGLLHDIGHGPFSHCFEDALKKGGINISHESWGEKIIESLSFSDKDKSEVIKILQKKHDLSWIISSQMDADRFDYLLRDSHFCGVAYGHFELDWLISCISISEDGLTPKLTYKGIRAFEHYIMARKLMNINVYFHKKKLASEGLFTVLISIILKEIERLKNQTHLKDSSIIQFLSKLARIKPDPVTLGDDLVDLYCKIDDHDVWVLLKQLHSTNKNDTLSKVLKNISQSFLYRKLPYIFKIRSGYYSQVKERIDIYKDKNKFSDLDNPFLLAEKSIITTFKSDKDKVFLNTESKSGSINQNITYSSELLKTETVPEKIEYIFFHHLISKKLRRTISFIEELMDEGVIFYSKISTDQDSTS